MKTPDREFIRSLAQAAIDRDEPTAWFDQLYQSAKREAGAIPWADLQPNPHLLEWLAGPDASPSGSTALVVGCGLGDDAIALAATGLQVTAFDVASTAIDWCLERFADAPVSFQVADLLDPPDAWQGAFDLVLESYTLQALPPAPRAIATSQLARFVRPGGLLLVIARGREPEDPPGTLPWPLTRNDLAPLLAGGLDLVRFEDFVEGTAPPIRRFRILYRRPA